jgi:peptidylprolyl isomerase/FKBP-type peptidyl-prolyl cis-trans isomerase FkpA
MEVKNRKVLLLIILLVIVFVIFLLVRPKESMAPANAKNTNQASLMQEQKMEELKIEILKEGTGEVSKNGDTLTVNYTGTLENGTKFDSSIGRTPFSFTLGENRVIQGREQGMLNMKVGEKRRLTIPSELGYGSRGAGSLIPPNATLIFEVDLLEIN